jgi:quinol-cytochrome oxidoreductase complex cytochrome b subunit
VGQLLLQLSVILLLVAMTPLPLLEPWVPGQQVPAGVRPPWPVMWYYTYVKMIDPFISVGLPIFLVLFALVVPLLDRRGGVSIEERWIWVAVAIVYIAIIGYGTVLGFLVDIPKEITPLTRISVPPDYSVPYIGTPQAVGP